MMQALRAHRRQQQVFLQVTCFILLFLEAGLKLCFPVKDLLKYPPKKIVFRFVFDAYNGMNTALMQ
jgi:hypothetical protein